MPHSIPVLDPDPQLRRMERHDRGGTREQDRGLPPRPRAAGKVPRNAVRILLPRDGHDHEQVRMRKYEKLAHW